MKFYYVKNIFDLQIFGNETTAPLTFLKICIEIRFVSLFFLNERNITILLLMIHLKCAVLKSSINRQSILKLRAVNYAIAFFFNFLFKFIFTRLLLKTLRKIYHF